jgi:hypothetical protein
LLAEWKTPGFLQYFIVGEHINRFLTPGWNGDKYGNAHAAPIGVIWIFWLYAACPFSLIALAWLVRRRRQLWQLLTERTRHLEGDGWMAYLVLWSSMHLFFFTAAGNVIWTYALTGLPAFACLAIEIQRHEQAGKLWRARGFIAASCVVPLVSIGLAALYLGGSASVKSSQKILVQTWTGNRTTSDSQLLYFLENYPSALFYSQGKATTTRKNAEIEALLRNATQDFIAVKARDLRALSPLVREHFHTFRQFDDITLMQETTDTKPTASLQ